MAMTSEMAIILENIGLKHLTETFMKEKITPDIVYSLSAFEMQQLGVCNSSDMMTLRTKCSPHGNVVPEKVCVSAGAPSYSISKSDIESLIEAGLSIKEISTMLSVSDRTIYRRMQQFGLSKTDFSEISDDELDTELRTVIQDFPMCGEKLLTQLLRQNNVYVQRWRLRDSIHRVDVEGTRARSIGRLHRRVYDVRGPNDVWHVDTNHKLVRWRFIIIGGVDGFSRLIMFLTCSDNNTSKTVLETFLSGVNIYGHPNRVRTDKGLENIDIARYMIIKQGENSMITGKSTHNQRIERLWRDVFEGVLCFFYNLFYFMEDEGLLDPLNEIHIAALHYIYKVEINRRLDLWKSAWAKHRIRTVKSSPLALWASHQYRNTNSKNSTNYEINEETFNSDDIDTDDGRPVFQLLNILNEQCLQALSSKIPFIRISDNHGINDYCACVDVITRYLQMDSDR